MDWITVAGWFLYLAIGLSYAIYINKDWFKKAKTDKDEVDEPMLYICTTLIAITWPIISITWSLFLIIRLIKKITK